MKVLLVEDDIELTEILSQGFAEQGIRTTTAGTFGEGLGRATQVNGGSAPGYDVIVLDVLLPGGDGFQLCAEIRKRRIATPILMLTALDAVNDRVRGLEAGADDYVVKPFAFRELLARIRAVARRPPALATDKVVIEDLVVDLESKLVTRRTKRISLTVKEFALLEYLVRHRDRVVDRAAITAHVWGEDYDPFTNVLEVLVRRLRRKIDDDFEPKLIHTLRGSGYRIGV